ncbi:hypothetical protein [Sulfitobacter faviae]|uniref:hypothetical protein n=1 Tax=Sulfitobacter faviae TaxID=1775881 RepID=UPI002458A74B|nr:hypothetical protein [Sulfitobacter faviae]
MDRVRIDRLRRGDWLDIPLQLIGQGKGNPVQVVLGGGTLDMRRAEFGAAEGQAGPPMRVALDRWQITDTIYLTDLSGTFDTAKGMDGAFTARLNGGTPVQGRVLPQAGRSAVRVVSDDAGGVLRSTGLVKQVVGGTCRSPCCRWVRAAPLTGSSRSAMSLFRTRRGSRRWSMPSRSSG